MYTRQQENTVITLVKSVYAGQRVVHVRSSEILLRIEGKHAITRSAHQVAEETGIIPEDVINHLYSNMYYMEPSGILVLVIMLPEHGMEMVAEVPAHMWMLKSISKLPH